jgi:hypothetical protein
MPTSWKQHLAEQQQQHGDSDGVDSSDDEATTTTSVDSTHEIGMQWKEAHPEAFEQLLDNKTRLAILAVVHAHR